MSRNDDNIPIGKIIFGVIALICLILAAVTARNLYESVDAGTYHITQSPFSGNVHAQMAPGPYNRAFCSVSVWPVSESYDFTHDADLITVTFNDGATAQLAGTVRIDLPKSESDAEALVVKHGYRSFDDLNEKLILRALRNTLNMTANLMTSRESYSERRADFLRMAKDQLENGVYVTQDLPVKESDPVTGEQVTRIHKVPKLDEKGNPIREDSPFNEFGLRAYGLEIREWRYSDRVMKQMEAQQEATMAVQTARAKSMQAEQEAKMIEAQGQANVMKVKYDAAQIAETATVNAKRDADVATIAAQKDVDVARLSATMASVKAQQVVDVAALGLQAAKLQAQTTLANAEAEAKARQLILAADGALDKKLAAIVQINQQWADAYAHQNVPSVVMGGGSEGRNAVSFMDILGAKAANDLALDMKVTKPVPSPYPPRPLDATTAATAP